MNRVLFLVAAAPLCACATTYQPLSHQGTDAKISVLGSTPPTIATSKPSADDDGLLETLLKNGSLEQHQYDRLTSADTDAPAVTMGSRGFRVKSSDGDSSIKVGGRVQVDFNHHDNSGVDDALIQDGTELRRARIEMKGTLDKGVLWAAEVDFANNATSVKDFWMGFEVDENSKLMLGHQKQPYSLAVEMSSNDIPFVERGVDTFLVAPFVDRAVGARFDTNNDSTFFAGGLYGESVSPNSTDDEGWGAVARVVHAPIIEDEKVVHLALRAGIRAPEDDIRIRDESTNMSNFRAVDTGAIADVDSVMLYGAEAVYATGPFSIGGEFNSASIESDGGDLDFSSWHVQGTYSLTGESRAKAYRIDAGEFKRLRAHSAEEEAWEVSARLANLDLNDGAFSGGSEDVVSVGLNWYYSANVRFLLNWSHVLDTSGGSAVTSAAEGVNLVTLRAQINF